MINLKEYFARIGYAGTPNISLKTLCDIHTAHAFSIPFENLDIHDLSKNKIEHIIKLDTESLSKKLINANSG